MQITRLTVALNVDDLAAAESFYVAHFGFRVTVSNEHVLKLEHDERAYELCFMRRGTYDDSRADGVILALEVADAAAEEARLRSAGVPITAPLQDEPWGERLFQVRDPNGVTVQLVEWVTSAAH